MAQGTPSLNNLIFGIINVVRGRSSSTEIITEEMVAYFIKSVRSQLIKQESNKQYSVDSFIIQEIPCVAVSQVDKGECCEVTGCSIYRTSLAIPSPIELHHKQLITRIGSIDKTQIPFDLIDYAMVPYISFSRWTKNRPKVFTMNNNGYFYFILPEGGDLEGLQKISIQGVFEDPMELANYSSCDGTFCFADDKPYPIKSWMVPVLTEMVVKMFIKPQSQALQDPNNNSKFDLEQPIINQNPQ